MTATLKSDNLVPYGGGFRVTDPMTGLELYGTTFESLMGRVYESRRANGIPIGVGIVQEFEQLACASYPEECTNLDPTFPRKRSLTLTDIVHGTKTMLSLWWNKKPLVDRAEAERRARICVACPLNVQFYKRCSGICPELRDVVTAIIDHQGTQYDAQLQSCSICGCFTRAAIWVDQKTQWDALDENTKAQFKNLTTPCWKPPKD